MLDRSFIEKIESMSAPQVVETAQGVFAKNLLYRVENKTVDTITVGTISGLATLIKNEVDKYIKPLYVRVTAPERIDVFGGIRDDVQRDMPFKASADFARFDFEDYMSVERMIIGLKSRFEPTEDREYLVQLLGNITDQRSVQTKDDGITQSATVKSGIQLVGEQRIKPIVKLKPYRTFLEVEQPESEFLIRLKDGRAALFEADGGAWKNQAMKNVGELLRNMLKDVDDVIVVE